MDTKERDKTNKQDRIGPIMDRDLAARYACIGSSCYSSLALLMGGRRNQILLLAGEPRAISAHFVPRLLLFLAVFSLVFLAAAVTESLCCDKHVD